MDDLWAQFRSRNKAKDLTFEFCQEVIDWLQKQRKLPNADLAALSVRISTVKSKRNSLNSSTIDRKSNSSSPPAGSKKRNRISSLTHFSASGDRRKTEQRRGSDGADKPLNTSGRRSLSGSPNRHSASLSSSPSRFEQRRSRAMSDSSGESKERLRDKDGRRSLSNSGRTALNRNDLVEVIMEEREKIREKGVEKEKGVAEEEAEEEKNKRGSGTFKDFKDVEKNQEQAVAAAGIKALTSSGGGGETVPTYLLLKLLDFTGQEKRKESEVKKLIMQSAQNVTPRQQLPDALLACKDQHGEKILLSHFASFDFSLTFLLSLLYESDQLSSACARSAEVIEILTESIHETERLVAVATELLLSHGISSKLIERTKERSKTGGSNVLAGPSSSPSSSSSSSAPTPPAHLSHSLSTLSLLSHHQQSAANVPSLPPKPPASLKDMLDSVNAECAVLQSQIATVRKRERRKEHIERKRRANQRKQDMPRSSSGSGAKKHSSGSGISSAAGSGVSSIVSDHLSSQSGSRSKGTSGSSGSKANDLRRSSEASSRVRRTVAGGGGNASSSSTASIHDSEDSKRSKDDGHVSLSMSSRRRFNDASKNRTANGSSTVSNLPGFNRSSTFAQFSSVGQTSGRKKKGNRKASAITPDLEVQEVHLGSMEDRRSPPIGNSSHLFPDDDDGMLRSRSHGGREKKERVKTRQRAGSFGGEDDVTSTVKGKETRRPPSLPEDGEVRVRRHGTESKRKQRK